MLDRTALANIARASCAACLIAGSGLVTAGEALNCMLVNKVSDAGELKRLTNREVENGLCIISKQAVEALAADQTITWRVCLAATANLIKEFNLRFPGRDGKEVMGRC
jgi:hypothetical protein